MSRGPHQIRRTTISKVLKAAREAGFNVARIEKDGTVIVGISESEPAAINGAGAWDGAIAKLERQV
jgi:hypothetical protein